MKNKKIIIFLIIFVFAVLFGFLWYKQSKNKKEENNKKILYQEKNYYSEEDFPALANEPEERARLVKRLNEVYEAKDEHPKKPYPYWIEIGLLKKALKDYKGAEDAWRNAVMVVKRPTIAYGNLADLYFYFLKDYDKAEEYYLKALELTPGNITYRKGLADLYRYKITDKKDQVEKIILEGAKKDYNNRIEYYVYLVDFFRSENNRKKAEEYRQKVREIDPDRKLYTDYEE